MKTKNKNMHIKNFPLTKKSELLMPLSEVLAKIRLVFDSPKMNGICRLEVVGMYGTTRISLKWSGKANAPLQLRQSATRECCEEFARLSKQLDNAVLAEALRGVRTDMLSFAFCPWCGQARQQKL